MNRIQKIGTVVAMAAAGMLVANTSLAGEKKAAAKPKAAGVKCEGINSCKGTGACGGAGHSCKGQNECKGKGWTMADSEKACTDKGGKVVKAEEKKAEEPKKS